MDLYLDLKNQALRQSYKSSNPPILTFYQGDTPQLVLRGMARNADPLGNAYSPAHISYASLMAEITLINVAPASGTFKVMATDGSTPLVTGVLTYDAALTKAAFAAALNALENVTAAGGVTAIATGAANVFGIIWNRPADALTLSVVENKLAPFCLSGILEDPEIPGKVEIKLFQAPVAFTNQFTLPTPPPPVLSRVRVGSVSANEIQRITIPGDAVGGFAFVQGGNAGKIVRVDSTALQTDITAALNDPFTVVSATDVRFSVSNPASGVYDIEFIGSYSKAPQEELVLSLFDQSPQDTPAAWLPLTGPAIEDLLAGAKSAPAQLLITSLDAEGRQTTLCYQQCTIMAEGLDSGGQGVQVIESIATRIQTVTINPAPDVDPVVVAMLGQQFVVGVAALDYTFVHDFGTLKVDVVCLRRTSEVPEKWSQVDDTEFDWETESPQAIHVWFGAEPAVEGIGSVEVWVRTLSANALINLHRHTTDSIDGVGTDEGKTLTEIIVELRNSLPTGWPNIPAGKISGKLTAEQIDLSSLSKALASSADFLTTLRTLITDSELVSNLSKALATNADFLTTLKTLAANTDFLAALMAALGTNSDFISAVKTAVGSMQIPGTMSIPFAPIAEVLFTSETDTSKLAARAPYMLPQITSVAPADLTDPLPDPVANTVWRNVSGASVLISVGGKIRSENIGAGGYVGSDGRALYAVTNSAGSSYYPTIYERELWRLYVNDKMLSVGKTLTIAFTVALQLINADSAAQYVLVIEKGSLPQDSAPAADNLQEIVWDTAYPIVKQQIVLTPTVIPHDFGALIARTSAGITAKGVYYGTAYDAPAAPASANQVFRAMLKQFDTQNSVPLARGWVSYQLIKNSFGNLGAKIA